MALEGPDMEVVINKENDDILEKDGQTEFRSVVAKLTAFGQHSRHSMY